MENTDLKQAYADKLEAQFKGLSADLDKLKAKAQGAGADARIAVGHKLEELKAQHQKAAAQLEDYRRASQDKLEGLRLGLEKSWSDLKASVDSALRG